MKKTLIMKIMSGAVLTAMTIAGAVNVAATEADIPVAAESGAYVAGTDAENLAVSADALTVSKTERTAAEDKAETEEAAAEDKAEAEEAVVEDNAGTEKAAAASAAAGTTETNDAEETEAAGAVPSTQSAQSVRRNPRQAVQNTQPAQKADVVTEDDKEDQVYTAASESIIRVEFPPEEGTGDDEGNRVYTATSEYTIVIEFPPEEEPAAVEEPAPAPAPVSEPVYVEVTRYNCNCGYTTYNYDELKQHMFQHALNGDRNSYSAHVEKVQQ